MRARSSPDDIHLVIALFHDQGLIPIKYLGIDHGVNITLGLPFVRTSVDHGTAFDIAHQWRQAQHLYSRPLIEQGPWLKPTHPNPSILIENVLCRETKIKPNPALAILTTGGTFEKRYSESLGGLGFC